MASRVRYIVKVGGSYYCGSRASTYLLQSGLRGKTLADKIKAASDLGIGLWVFREPRRVAAKRSRYKQIVRKYRIAAIHHAPHPDYGPALAGVLAKLKKKPKKVGQPNGIQPGGGLAQGIVQAPDFMPQWEPAHAGL